MATLTQIPTIVGAQVIQTMKRTQDAVVQAVGRAAQVAERREISLPLRQQWPTVKAAVDAGFALAQQALAAQRDFVNNLLDAVAPGPATAPTAPETGAPEDPAKATPHGKQGKKAKAPEGS